MNRQCHRTRWAISSCLFVTTIFHAACGQSGSKTGAVPAPYLTTRDQAGHEFVKTEQFVVPVGTAVAVNGLQFYSDDCRFTGQQEVIMRQVFNSLEEITENTVNDQDAARVADFKQMVFEIRGHSSVFGNEEQDRALGMTCATRAKLYLTTDGTATWRLTPKGYAAAKPSGGGDASKATITIDFLRTR